MEKKIVWALFDDGVGSWNHCGYDKELFTIISIGINDNPDWENYYKIDLSLNNYDLIKQLEKLPKPDIIVASPPCESWSIADNQQRLYRKATSEGTIELFTEQNILDNNEKMHKNRKRDYHKQWRTTLCGMETALATDLIVKHFNPKIWVIENPQTSKLWEFLPIFGTTLREGYANIAHYNSYNDEFTKKPTRFYSNVQLFLKAENKKSSTPWENVCGYDRRSSIPKDLLLDILQQILFYLV